MDPCDEYMNCIDVGLSSCDELVRVISHDIRSGYGFPVKQPEIKGVILNIGLED